MAAPETIRLGSSGASVTRWQELLAQAGYPVAATGTFDGPTDQATRSWQAAKGLMADGIVGPKSWGAMLGQPAFATDGKAEFGRTVLVHVWREVTGQDPNVAELQIAGAQAHLESFYGLASYTNKQTGAKSGPINNWGAIQGGKPPCGEGGFEASDTRADGTPYNWCYKRYPTPEDGARDFVRQITLRRPTAWNHMRRGDIDAYCDQLRHPKNGEPLYFEAPAETYAAGLAQRVVNIAGTLGEPVAAKRGGPVDPQTALGVSPGGGDGLTARRAAGPAVVGLSIAALVAIVLKWGWPWRWPLP